MRMMVLVTLMRMMVVVTLMRMLVPEVTMANIHSGKLQPHPTTLPKRKKLKPKTKIKQSNKNTPYDQSPPNSQPHQSPIDVIDNNIDNNSPHQFPVLQSNDPPSQTYSQELLDEFNSSDSH